MNIFTNFSQDNDDGDAEDGNQEEANHNDDITDIYGHDREDSAEEVHKDILAAAGFEEAVDLEETSADPGETKETDTAADSAERKKPEDRV